MCLYETDRNFIDTVTGFLVPALEEGQAGIVVATHRRVGAIEAALGDHGLDVEGAKCAEQLTLLDAATLLVTLPDDATLPRDRPYTMLLQTVVQPATAGRQIRLVSELGPLLCQRGQDRAAMALEATSTELAAAWPLTLLCPYPRPKPSGGQRAACSFEAIDARHTGVLPGEQTR